MLDEFNSGGGGGGSMMVVHVTDDNVTYYVCDKTWKEIYDAYIAGTFIIFSYDYSPEYDAISIGSLVSMYKPVHNEESTGSCVLYAFSSNGNTMSFYTDTDDENEYPKYNYD